MTYHNSGTCCFILIISTDIDVTFCITFVSYTVIQVYRSIQKPVQELRWANSPPDCSSSLVRNPPFACDRDEKYKTETRMP
jgi:hypothetical protein